MPHATTQNLVYRFCIRWFICGFGLWIAATIMSQSISYNDQLQVVVIGGLILAAINAIIKPIVVILSLPAILFSLGLFMIVINGLMVMLAAWVYDPLDISSIWSAMFAGMIIGMINYLVTAIMEDR